MPISWMTCGGTRQSRAASNFVRSRPGRIRLGRMNSTPPTLWPTLPPASRCMRLPHPSLCFQYCPSSEFAALSPPPIRAPSPRNPPDFANVQSVSYASKLVRPTCPRHGGCGVHGHLLPQKLPLAPRTSFLYNLIIEARRPPRPGCLNNLPPLSAPIRARAEGPLWVCGSVPARSCSHTIPASRRLLPLVPLIPRRNRGALARYMT